MNVLRAIRSGAVVWLLVISTFAILDAIPFFVKHPIIQALIISVLMVGYAIIGAVLYYRKATAGYGIYVALVISLTALTLDALITVPLYELPNGRSYTSFFTSPLLWILVTINMITASLVGWNRQRHNAT